MVRFVNALESELSSPSKKITLSIAEIMAAEDLNDVISIVNKTISQPQQVVSNKELDSNYQHSSL